MLSLNFFLLILINNEIYYVYWKYPREDCILRMFFIYISRRFYTLCLFIPAQMSKHTSKFSVFEYLSVDDNSLLLGNFPETHQE